MVKKNQRETATVNIRIYKSTRDTLSALARKEGKTIGRVLDEHYNPAKYVEAQA